MHKTLFHRYIWLKENVNIFRSNLLGCEPSIDAVRVTLEEDAFSVV
jgi:hypothetical protein